MRAAVKRWRIAIASIFLIGAMSTRSMAYGQDDENSFSFVGFEISLTTSADEDYTITTNLTTAYTDDDVTSPTIEDTISPTISTSMPSDFPSITPSIGPSHIPSDTPSLAPTVGPSWLPSVIPSIVPSTASPSGIPTSAPIDEGKLVSFGGKPPDDKFPLDRCRGDCDNDSHCANGLVCYQRYGHANNDPVPGCFGIDIGPTDYCVHPDDIAIVTDEPTQQPLPTPTAQATPLPSPQPTPQPSPKPTPQPSPYPLSKPQPQQYEMGELKSFGGTPSKLPLGLCEGDCDSNSDCANGLICYQRGGGQSYDDMRVPGCYGVDPGATDYCTYPDYVEYDSYDEYAPGKLNIVKEGLLLSQGLDVKLIATSGEPVTYYDGGGGGNNNNKSSIPFHGRPDGAAIFKVDDNDSIGDWIYVSNSEMRGSGEGGVGAMTFDSSGNVKEYKMILQGTTQNCNGGKTPWNTWISCEENQSHGRIFQVDPTGKRDAQRLPHSLLGGGNWESFAYDVRDPNNPHFFITEDLESGALRRYTPSEGRVSLPEGTKLDDKELYWDLLHDDSATVEYLVLDDKGTYSWTEKKDEGLSNAKKYYQFSEGIDVHDSYLYFVCKEVKELFILNLDDMTWTKDSTKSGLFGGQPDQLKRILGGGGTGSGNGSNSSLLYFTEDDEQRAGIHARDEKGRYFTIVESIEHVGETTGLALSPNGMYMLFAYQKYGKLFMIWRRDGLPFPAEHLDIKYHSTT